MAFSSVEPVLSVMPMMPEEVVALVARALYMEFRVVKPATPSAVRPARFW